MSTRAQARSASSRPSGPPPPPRTRAATAKASRATARRRRRLLVLGAVVAALLAVAYGVSRSPLLAVDTVRVVGTSHLSRQQVVDAAGVHEGDAMVWIDTGAALDGMRSLPYVRDVTLRREWPHTVRITVHERTPAAWVEAPGGKVLVDGTGRVLEQVDAPPQGVPQLVGAKVVPLPGGTIDVGGAARVAGALHGLVAAGTASVDATPDGVVLHLVSGPEVRMGEPTQVAVKLRAASAVLAALDGQPVGYVDVSVPTNPVTG